MFTIYSGGRILHHPNSGEFALSAKTANELNTQGSLKMTLDNPLFLDLRDPIEAYDDDGMIWRGRVLSIDNGFDKRKNIHCEGALAFLCDTIVQPFSFRGRPDDDTSGGQTVKGLFHQFIDIHNNQLSSGDPRRFTIGQITVTDPNNYIYRSSETAMTTWDAINSKLIDTLGGYVYLSGENLNVINYVADFDTVCTQTIRFGENLIDLMQSNDASGIVTALHAYGAQYPEETSIPPREVEPGDPQTPGYDSWNGNRLHVIVTNLDAVARWGLIFGTNTWDDITLEANLRTAAGKWLNDNLAAHVESIECTAADLSLTDASIDKIDVGMKIHVVCAPLDLDTELVCTRKETDLINISETKISIGRPQSTLSGMVGG